MSTPERRVRIAVAALLLAAGAAVAATPQLGRPLDDTERAALAGRSIYPDGRGLPPGAGRAREGAAVYAQHCQRCHGEQGRGGSGGTLISGAPLDPREPDPAIDNYWPYATTLFDFTRRAMPLDRPGTLSDDEVYAVTAYLLRLAGLVDDDTILNPVSLPRIRMPNRDGFVGIDAAVPARNEKRITKSRPPG